MKKLRFTKNLEIEGNRERERERERERDLQDLSAYLNVYPLFRAIDTRPQACFLAMSFC